jgi:hypothetical protein
MKRFLAFSAILISVASAVSPQAGKIGASSLFVPLEAKVGAGIIFDGKGTMFAATDGKLLAITPEGKASTFCDLSALPKGKDYFFPSPLIWGMAFDSSGNILAAAQDRVLRISPEGKIETLIREDFDGFVGASGIEVDREGNLYVTSGSKVLKYDKDLKKSVYLDSSAAKLTLAAYGRKFDVKPSSLFSLAFDESYSNLYLSDFDSKTLLRYPLGKKGKPGKPVIVIDPVNDSLAQSPLNVAFSDDGSLYVSIDISSLIVKVDESGAKSAIRISGVRANHMIAIGGTGFETDCIYFTSNDGAGIYKLYANANRR